MVGLRINDCGVSGWYCGWMMMIIRLIDEDGVNFCLADGFLEGGFR